MQFEHFALNVSDPKAMSAWYVAHLGFSIILHMESAPHTHFLADDTGRCIMELYANASEPIPDYFNTHPVSFHLAVVATDAKAEQGRLERAGATFFDEKVNASGALLVMMRDSWGIPIQLCQRSKPIGTT